MRKQLRNEQIIIAQISSIQATGDVPAVYSWLSLRITVYDTAMNNLQEIVAHCCIYSSASPCLLQTLSSQVKPGWQWNKVLCTVG